MEQLSATFYNLTMRFFHLLGAAGDNQPSTHSVFISSVRAGEGKTFMAKSLAAYLAGMTNDKILLVDGNFERPALHEEWGIANGIGFSDCLATGDYAKAVPSPTQWPNLMLLPAGQNRKPGLLFKPQPMQNFLAHMGREYGIILIDGATIPASGCLPHVCGGIVLVIDTLKTRREVVRGVMAKANIDRSKYHGVILNRKMHYIPKYFYKFL